MQISGSKLAVLPGLWSMRMERTMMLAVDLRQSVIVCIVCCMLLCVVATATESSNAARDASRVAEVGVGEYGLRLETSPNNVDEYVVSWQTPELIPSIVRWGLSAASLPNQIVGSFTNYSFSSYRSRIIHTAVIPNTQPGRVTYFYQFAIAAEQFSSVKSFTTRPACAVESVVFGVVSDTTTAKCPELFGNLTATQQIDYLLHLGDFANGDAVAKEWDTFQDVAATQSLMGSVPSHVVFGNHDDESKYGTRGYRAALARLRKSPFFAINSTYNYYYNVSVGSVQFVLLCSNLPIGAGSAQNEWLRDTLQSIDRKLTPFVIILVHAPPYSSSSVHKPYMELRAALEQYVLQYHVTMVLAAHEHFYERTYPVYNETVTDASPSPAYRLSTLMAPLYVSGASGGQTLFTPGPQAGWSAFVHSMAYGFSVMSVSYSLLRYQYFALINDSAQLTDQFVIANDQYPMPSSPCAMGACMFTPCQHGATCVPTQTRSFVCQCAPGFSGSSCETDVDECVSSPCVNGGTCRDGLNSFVCQCPQRYCGALCNHDSCAGACSSNSGCSGHGVCEKPQAANGWTGWNGWRGQNAVNGTCSCVRPYTGCHCELCESGYVAMRSQCIECFPDRENPCFGHGTCVYRRSSGVGCVCNAGYSGDLCQNRV